MNKRWLVIILIVSIAFNLAVLGGFLYMRHKRNTFMRSRHNNWQERGSRTGGRNWNPHIMLDDSTRVRRESFNNAKKELMLELAKEPVDMNKIDSIIEHSLKAQNELERDLAVRLIHMRNDMTPEEAKEHFTRRAEYIGKRNERGDNRNPHPNPHYQRRPR